MVGITNIPTITKCKTGIKIKKSHLGLFTKYCNGKVTQKCIDKAKRSGNKKLVKRAVFAENSRKWKHQDGGLFKRLDIEGLRRDPEYINNYNWHMNDANLTILEDSMINRNMGFPQRVAVFSQVIPESGGETKRHSNGSQGVMSWRGSRTENLPSTIQGQAHKVMSEIYDNPTAKDWSHGGAGTGVKTGKEMMQLFITTPNTEQATKAFMKGYVRPETSEWQKRLEFINLLKRYMK